MSEYQRNLCRYGPAHLLLTIICASGLVLTYLATIQCNFFKASYGLSSYAFINPDLSSSRGVGIWAIEKEGHCVGWGNDHDMDFYMIFARIMSLSACFFSLVFLTMVLLPYFSSVGGDDYMRKISQFLFLMAPFTACLLLSLVSDKCSKAYSCKADTGFFLCIGAVGTWLIASMLACLTTVQPPPEIQEQPDYQSKKAYETGDSSVDDEQRSDSTELVVNV